MFGCQEIPVFSESSPFTCCRVSVAERVTLPACRKTIVPGELHMRNGCMSREVREPTGCCTCKDNGVLVGRTFVSTQQKRDSLRVFNLQPEASVLYKGTQVAEEVVDKTVETYDDTGLGPALDKSFERNSENLSDVQPARHLPHHQCHGR